MSLTVEFQPHTGSRLLTWSENLDMPLKWYVSSLILETLGLGFLHENSPHCFPLSEADAPHESEREKEITARSRTAGEALTRKAKLHSEIERLTRLSSQLENEATDALRSNDRDTAKQRLQMKAATDKELQTCSRELSSTEAVLEEIKQRIRASEERIKARITADFSVRFDDVPAGNTTMPSDTEPMRVTLDFSQDSEALVAVQASERGLTSEEYISTIADRLVELADLVTPKDMPMKRDRDVHHDTPIEEILNEAVREMKENQIKNREYAVKAITQKNNLLAQVGKEERILAEYKRKALAAVDDGNRELAQKFYKETLPHEQTLTIMRTLLTQATDIAEKVKQQIILGEERVRIRTSKALLLKTNLTASAIAFRLDILLDETQPSVQEEFQQNFEDWIHSQRLSGSQ
jgi:phage shock protein A